MVKAKGWSSHEVFYPAASLYALVALPASVVAMETGGMLFPALREPAAHAHEMLVGFALAVVAGNQLGAVRGPAIGALLLLWMAARAAFLLAPDGVLATGFNAAFAGALALRIVPRLLGAAKKWRNQTLPGAIGALCIIAAYWQFTRYAGDGGVPHVLMLALVAVFALLMLFMGGRIVAPALAGQFYRQGTPLDARVQPRLEATLLVAGAITPVALVFPQLHALAGVSAVASGALALVRLARWRLWALQARPDLVCLAVGYGWLGVGLLLLGSSLLVGRHEPVAVHVITIGALGTLTFNVMATFWTLKSRRPQAQSALVVPGTVLLAVATGMRLLAVFHGRLWLYGAAACWSLAFALLIVLFWRNRQPFEARRADGSA